MKKRTLTALLLTAVLLCTAALSASAAVFSFEETYVDYRNGDNMTDTYMSAEWNSIFRPEGAVIQGEGENPYLHVDGYYSMVFNSTVDTDTDAYEISCDLRTLRNGDGVALFLRAGNLVYKDNVFWHSMANPYMLPMDFYEWDFYGENGGTHGTSGMGSSGILIQPLMKEGTTNGVIRVVFKTHEEDGLNVGNQGYEFDSPVPVNEFFTLKASERDNVITITVNGELLCTVEFSDEGTYADDLFHGQEASYRDTYYKSAKIKGADGTELFSEDTCRIAKDGRFALASRNGSFDVDNIKIDFIYDEEETTEAPTEAPTDPETEAPTDESTDGATEVPTTEATDAPAEVTTAAPAEETTAPAEGDTEPEKSGCGSSIGISAAMLLTALAAAFVQKKH